MKYLVKKNYGKVFVYYMVSLLKIINISME